MNNKNGIQFLHDLVAIRSLSGEEAEVAAFLVREMAKMGYEAFVDEAGNAVGIRDCVDGNGRISQTVALLGHMDTVPGDIPVRIEDGILYGRGSVDAKGPLATFILAGAKAELPPGTRLVIIGAVEEESATSKGARYVASQFRPDFCIIGEPSGWDGVTLGYKGRILIDYECGVPMSHTAGDALGAAETAVAWWNTLTAYIGEFNANRPKLFDQLIPSLREFHTLSDGLTNKATLKVGIRLPPHFDCKQFQANIRQMDQMATLTFYGYEPAFQSSRTTLLARQFNRALRQAGQTPRFKVKTGTSDMNVVGPIWDCPIVAYGPGDSTLDHTPNEHLQLAEFEQAIVILSTVLASLSKSG